MRNRGQAQGHCGDCLCDGLVVHQNVVIRGGKEVVASLFQRSYALKDFERLLADEQIALDFRGAVRILSGLKLAHASVRFEAGRESIFTDLGVLCYVMLCYVMLCYVQHSIT